MTDSPIVSVFIFVQRSSSWNKRTNILLFQELGVAFGQKTIYIAKAI